VDGLRLAPLLLVVPIAAACGSGRPSRLLYGEPAGRFSPVPGSVLTASRTLPAATLAERLERCLFGRDRGDIRSDAAVVERIGVKGESLTVAARNRNGVYACDGGVDPAREHRLPWCGEVFGRLVAGSLLDPRLDVACLDRDGKAIAYAFVEPVAGAHWIGVDQGRYVEIYEVLAGLPVRVATTRGVDLRRARATYEVREYDLHGRELVRRRLQAAVAG
jgi:hypothetical protein